MGFGRRRADVCAASIAVERGPACSTEMADDTIIDYHDYTPTRGLALNGSASRKVDVVRLTRTSSNAASSVLCGTPLDATNPTHTSFALSAHAGTAIVARLTFVVRGSCR